MNASALVLSACTLSLLSACSGASLLPKMAGPVQTVYEGPKFWTLTETYDAVAVDAGGRVAALYKAGDDALSELPPTVARVRLAGALAVAGLRDGHVHLTWIGRAGETVDLRGAVSPAEVSARVVAFAAAHPDVKIIIGSGWDHTRFPTQAFPHAADLPGPDTVVGDRVVVLSRVDGHAIWVNTAGLAPIARQLARPSHATGERILVDEAGPTGVVVDPSAAIADAYKTEPTPADLARWLLRGMQACADAGLVEVHDMATSVAELAAMQRLSARLGALPLRVVVYLDTSDASWAWLEARIKTPTDFFQPVQLTPYLRVAGVKAFADGALGSRGAALKAPYHDEPTHLGQPTDLATLKRHAARIHALGLQIAIHAIGDLGNAHALDAIAAAQGADTRRLHRVEHAQVVGSEEIARMVTLGVVASMQPTHATSDMRWAEQRLGPDRIAGAYAWRTMLDHSIPLAFGSDAPVESHRPTLGLYAAVTRQDTDGAPRGGWRIGERLTSAEAVRAFTYGVAKAAHDHGHSGRLAIGQRFEVTVLDRDPRTDGQAWRDATIAGRVNAPWR